MDDFYIAALGEIGNVFERIDGDEVARAVGLIAAANRIALYGVGREGLQTKGFAMRLFHLGLQVSVVGDMTTPPIGRGDLLVVSAGPGSFSTVMGLIGVARQAGAKVLTVTAQAEGEAARASDLRLVVPAQTMADDCGPVTSALPMGSLYEGAQYLLFERMILSLRDRLGLSAEAMRAKHTNME